ncbi:MAG: HDOD domain-containing protein [Desulfobacteraceae bacterium]|nr:HDOD domain-containing protein [Desulfobacteraceae bacterium]
MQTRLQALINSHIEGLPTLPTVATRVLEITADVENSTKVLWEVIASDQALAGNVMRIANSVFYGLPKQVTSLEQALNLLGYVEIRNLVIAQVVFNSFKHVDQNGPLDLRPLWAHAFTCALASKLITRHTSLRDQDTYIACLVHDIGKLVIYTALPEAYAEMTKEVGAANYTVFEMEERFFGITHEQVTARILETWLFPDPVVAAVANHHHPEKAAPNDLFTWVVHAADLLTHWSDAVSCQDQAKREKYQRILLRPEMGVVFNLFGNWHADTLENTRRQLMELKGQQQGMLALFTA